MVASRMSRMFSISSRLVEELLEPRPGHVRHVAAGDHDVAHRGRTSQVGEHLRVPVDRLAQELELVDHRGGVADEVHARAVAAVLRAGRQQLGEHLGGVAVREALGHPHVVLVQRVAGRVRVRRDSRCAGRRTPEACSGGPGRRRSPRSASRPAPPSCAAPSCSSSAAAPASTWWPARPGRAPGRRRTRSSSRSPNSARSCRMFLTQCARCHWTDAHSSAVTSFQPGNRVQSGSTSSTRL